jgi:hypothetical protein
MSSAPAIVTAGLMCCAPEVVPKARTTAAITRANAAAIMPIAA